MILSFFATYKTLFPIIIKSSSLLMFSSFIPFSNINSLLPIKYFSFSTTADTPLPGIALNSSTCILLLFDEYFDIAFAIGCSDFLSISATICNNFSFSKSV